MANASNHTRKMRLSVAMIVRDEESVLADTIESVKAIADEIVVFDTGSIDGTQDLAKKLGARLICGVWEDDFAAARNRCLEQVSGDWILWLDAGERLEEAEELADFIATRSDSRDIYAIFVEVPPNDPTASAERVAKHRLMPRHPKLRFKGRVRETLLPAIEEIGLTVELAPGRIVRHACQHDAKIKTRKAKRDLKLVELELSENGHPTMRGLLAEGEAAANLGDNKRAQDAFSAAIKMGEQGVSEQLEAYYGLLTTFDTDPNGKERQLAVCLEAMEIYPLDVQLLCAMGNYLQGKDRIDLAARAFRTAVEHGQVDLETVHLCEIAEVAVVCLALVMQLQNSPDEAKAVLESARETYPDSIRIKRHLLDLYIKQELEGDALELAKTFQLDDLQRESFYDAVRGACNAVQEKWDAALGYLQSAYVAGCKDVLCLRWLSVTLLSNGQIEAAEPCLREWLELEPANVEVRMYLQAIVSKASEEDVDMSKQYRVDTGVTDLDPRTQQPPIIVRNDTADIDQQ